MAHYNDITSDADKLAEGLLLARSGRPLREECFECEIEVHGEGASIVSL
jgi:hypothetical protein